MTTSRFTIDDIKDALSTCSQLNNFTWNTNGLTDYLTFDYSDMSDEYKTKTQSASKVIDSKVLDANNNVVMNWNTALFTNSGNSDMRSIFGGDQDNTPPITEWNSDLSSLNSGDYMFYYTNLASFNGDLSSLTNGDRMFAYCSTLESFNSDLSSLTDGEMMFYKSALTSFDSDLPSLTDGYQMFDECTNLTSFNSKLPKLTNGSFMFNYCSALTSFDSDLSSMTNGTQMFYYTNLASFNSDLSSLTYGYGMFYSCTALESFDSDLSSLTNGERMFSYCTALESFNSDLSSLTNGYQMFYYTNLASFNSDLSSLTNGLHMFQDCTALESFNSDLPNLTSGGNMFLNCKLDTASVQNIASTINTVSSGSITIGIGNSTPNEEESSAFNTIASKGWIVYVNGTYWTPTSSTNLTDGEEEQFTPIPFYAKTIQVTEDVAEYIDSNNNYYNIVGAQFIYGDDLSTYGQFTSYEHAVSEITLSLGLTKYIKPTEEK